MLDGTNTSSQVENDHLHKCKYTWKVIAVITGNFSDHYHPTETNFTSLNCFLINNVTLTNTDLLLSHSHSHTKLDTEQRLTVAALCRETKAKSVNVQKKNSSPASIWIWLALMPVWLRNLGPRLSLAGCATANGRKASKKTNMASQFRTQTGAGGRSESERVKNQMTTQAAAGENSEAVHLLEKLHHKSKHKIHKTSIKENK